METFTFQSRWSQKIYIFHGKIFEKRDNSNTVLTPNVLLNEYEKFKKDTTLYISRMEIDK